MHSDRLDRAAIEQAICGRELPNDQPEHCRRCGGELWEGQPATLRVTRTTGETRWEIVGIWCPVCAPHELESSTLGAEDTLVEIEIAAGQLHPETWLQAVRPDVIDTASAHDEGGTDIDVGAVLMEVADGGE
ncbi:hypothetical protein SAMN06269185_3304 [Natronoarchaeum philippinense]|uniref:DUF8112 domain-containing protein n=1 Tax=Natronoarchaeum philippinense TaxID=558529 RepID=A0A285PAF5_NATPI|nr:hypothetical protein [Natronoarchaeum philippinense]SNZ18237.1 hypothetical protein SAMN06269185_3304 [Natronoarchaeum philippinense]